MIEFYVTGQNLRFYSPVIAADSLNYLTAKVNFSEEWDEYTHWLHFSQNDTVYDIELNEDDEITADDSLNLTVGEWEIYAHGTYEESRLTSVPVILTVKESGLIDGPLHVLPQTVAEQLDYKATSAMSMANEVKTKADNGEFDGKDGKSLTVVGYFDTYQELVDNITEPVVGEMYGVGEEAPYDLYLYDFVNLEWVNNGMIQGPAGPAGSHGATFTPSVDASGYISWTNDQGLPNPPTQNIAGPQGSPGNDGPAGTSAYEAAVAGGYTGTELAFNNMMAQINYHHARHESGGADPITVKRAMLASDVYSTENPKMNGTASIGTYATLARSNHVHPTDTSRAAANLSNVPSGSITKAMFNSEVYATLPPVMDGEASVGDLPGLSRSNHRHPSDTTRAKTDLSNVPTGTVSNVINFSIPDDQTWTVNGAGTYECDVTVSGVSANDHGILALRRGQKDGMPTTWGIGKSYFDSDNEKLGKILAAHISANNTLHFIASENGLGGVLYLSLLLIKR